MSNCSKCNETLITSDEIICSQCINHYHYLCEGITETSFNKQSKNTRSRYICNKCKFNWDKSKNISSKSTDSETSLQDLSNSMNFMSQKFDDFSKTVTKIVKKMSELLTI